MLSHHKHKANDIFLVTNKENEGITMQKILHPLKETSTKLMSKQYNTRMKFLHPVHQPTVMEETRRNQEHQITPKRKKNGYHNGTHLTNDSTKTAI